MQISNRDDELNMYKAKNSAEEVKKHEDNCKIKSPNFLMERAAGDFEGCFYYMCNDMEICIDRGRYVQFYDFDYIYDPCVKNITPAYDLFLNNGLLDLKYHNDISNDLFCQRYNSVIDSIEILIKRVITELSMSNFEERERKKRWFSNMLVTSAKSFEEALQRVLFLEQLLWQTGSRLVGLGRMDCYLRPFYYEDIKKGISKTEIYNEIVEFLEEAHNYYWYKSDVLVGDTGQVIILGGIEPGGEYVFDELSELLLEAVKNSKNTDPKVVLRVSHNMPVEVMNKAVSCMLMGNGSPLLSNDDVIIPALQQFGIKDDAYDYTTSACWEPLIGGKSSSMNNQACLSFVKALQNMLFEEQLDKIKDYSTFENKYFKYVKREIIRCKRLISQRRYSRNTLYSIFIKGCYQKKTDIVDGGAEYNNVGFTTVGIGNTVDALLNIKEYVFEKKELTLIDVKKVSLYNFVGYESLYDKLKDRGSFFGRDDIEITSLTNRIMRYVTEETKDYSASAAGKLKFGISSPSYIFESRNCLASFDGRKKGEPFTVHISNEKVDSYTELLSFAGMIDYYENRFNGNVLDLIFSPSFLERNLEKVSLMFLYGIEKGFFQLQTNVISSAVLKAAKDRPEEYGNLIVRVWGFSAYYVQLPEEFKDLLIKRAMENEVVA